MTEVRNGPSKDASAGSFPNNKLLTFIGTSRTSRLTDTISRATSKPNLFDGLDDGVLDEESDGLRAF